MTKNYRPISILSVLRKIYERVIYDQLYFIKVFSKLQRSFRKLFNTHQFLLLMIENWRKSLDIGGHAGAILTDLSKYINHELPKWKLNTHREGILGFLCSYLTENNEQKQKSYIEFEEIISGVSRGSILGRLLFNINIWFVSLNVSIY